MTPIKLTWGEKLTPPKSAKPAFFRNCTLPSDSMTGRLLVITWSLQRDDQVFYPEIQLVKFVLFLDLKRFLSSTQSTRQWALRKRQQKLLACLSVGLSIYMADYLLHNLTNMKL